MSVTVLRQVSRRRGLTRRERAEGVAWINDIEARHPGEWIAVDVRCEGRHGEAEAGILLAHTSDRGELLERAMGSGARNLLIRYLPDPAKPQPVAVL